MTDQCPYLEYRSLSASDSGRAAKSGDDDASVTTARADRPYCTAADEFVQPMRADVCNDRYGLDHGTDCEIYRDREGLAAVPPDGDDAGDAGGDDR